MAARNELRKRQQGEVARREESPQYYRPAVGVSETADEFVLRYDMPGVGKGNIDVTLDKGTLSVTGKAEPEESGEAVYRETLVGDHRREFTLPEGLDTDQVTADMSAGVLTVRIAKAEQARPRKIAITAD